MLTQKRLKEVLSYNKNTGEFKWKVRKANCLKIGDVAGSINNEGYAQIVIDGKSYKSHRLAWIFVHGKFPKDQIDHINHDRADNRWDNLRSVTRHENFKNQSIRSTNTSGVTGVFWHSRDKIWEAKISINGKLKNLGSFVDKGEAIKVRQAANIKYGYHKNHGK